MEDYRNNNFVAGQNEICETVIVIPPHDSKIWAFTLHLRQEVTNVQFRSTFPGEQEITHDQAAHRIYDDIFAAIVTPGPIGKPTEFELRVEEVIMQLELGDYTKGTWHIQGCVKLWKPAVKGVVDRLFMRTPIAKRQDLPWFFQMGIKTWEENLIYCSKNRSAMRYSDHIKFTNPNFVVNT